MKFKRRTILLWGISGAAISIAPIDLYAKAFSVNDFIALSVKLTKRPISDFSPDAAKAILSTFQSRGLTPALVMLSSNVSSNSELAAEIISDWYSGICKTALGPQVILFNEALLWQTASFLHPFGNCGGATDYWSLPPSDLVKT